MKNKKGYVLVTVLIIMMVLTAVSYLFADAIYSELAIARNNKAAAAAFSLAEAGIQEAIFRVQYDETTFRPHFLAGGPDDPPFTRNPALLNNGSYTVTIDYTAPGVATISSTGFYTLGLRTAQRQIEQIIAQATDPNDYAEDDAIYTISAGGESTGDVELKGANIKIYDGGMSSGRSLSITQGSIINVEKSMSLDDSPEANYNTDGSSTLNYDCYIDSDPDPLLPPELCSISASHEPSRVASGQMPEISFEAYKDEAINLNQYFEKQSDFDAHFFPSGTNSATANGVVFVEKSFEIADGRTFTMNGVLASSGSISIGKQNENGQLIVTDPGENLASGVLTIHSFNINAQGNFSGTGLVYIGESGDFSPSANIINLTGGILSRRVSVTDRTMIIHFNADVMNDTLGNPFDTPVIDINHWEEEY